MKNEKKEQKLEQFEDYKLQKANSISGGKANTLLTTHVCQGGWDDITD
ncbi:hypothetical protein L6Q79_11070 [bacterium]|nr:hypothetical protein [bacterium]NUN46225.1 hypothetical protein [bacterium]